MSNSYLSEKICVGAHPLNVPLVVRASIYILAASSNQKEHLAIWLSVGTENLLNNKGEA
jgi:hypothetical protein